MSDDCGCGTNDAAPDASGDPTPGASDGAAPRPAKGEELANDARRNPFSDGIDRRRLLQASGAVGATTALAGCSGGGDGADAEPTVFVFNNGDRTVSVIDAESDELLSSVYLDTTASFPANQYSTGVDADHDVLWLNVSGGVRAFDQRTLEEVAFVETGYGPNYPNLTPDGDHLLIASGGTTGMDPEGDEAHAIFRVDADRDSDAFGEVTDEIETGYVGPCDMTLGPYGEYAFVVDVADEALRVLSVDPFETVARVDAGEPVTEEGKVLPFMCTASFDGELLLVANGEGTLGGEPEVPREGSESVWDVSDPENPEEIAKITRDDGLPGAPITSEVAPDNTAAYLFIPGEGVGVIDLESNEYETTLDVGGSSIAGAWGPNREKLYVPVQDANQVAVIEHASREVVATIDAGEAPTGAVAGTVRPQDDAMASIQARLASLGVSFGDREASWCMDDHCYCG
ncbi:twin-arginine translocation signal domain-containing protein [Halorubrum sp. AD140]|uniref:twin-arginine translocation signal domain-containing protein n=1 Tax=Halorubrum sp. AD140 TaxID=3050073 RepID=UPI002ACC9E2D|nr:twin-arginine translocation signal domain-containing protein [Halorubrum sp. AD140]MDZ5810021.1 twin-arginine translocation signal domain-containing protein [Halorubrum sp. AD140]